jgi:hypothetical protein
VRIDPTTALWCVTDPTPHSTLPDVCFETTLRGLGLQVAGGLDLGAVTIHADREEAEEDARNRLLVARIARQIRIDRRLPEGEAVRVTLHGADGRVIYQGEVR